MKYRVFITPEAEANIRAAFEYIRADSATNAARWLRDLHRQIDSLETFPKRCATAREAAYFHEDLRQLIFKSHCIIYMVDEKTKTVHVLFVRHASQRAVGEAGATDDPRE